ncbi:MAG: ImpA family type VI secretion system protein [Phenylobacterium sp.]
MALDLDQLLAPVSEEEPAGPDLAYDAGRQEIEQAFETSISIDSSGAAEQGADVDWRHTINAIVAQSAQTKDVWLAVYLCRAGALSGDLQTVETGAKYLAGLLEQYWPTVHPQLEEYGFQGRKGPCDSLVGLPQFLNPLRRLTLLSHPRLGQYSGQDFERFHSGGDGEDGYGMFRAALEDVGQEGLDEIAVRLDAILDGLKRSDLVLTANADDGGATNFQPAYEALNQLKRAVLAFGSTPMAEEAAPDGAGAADGGAGGGKLSGRVDSREDVARALEAIGDYYRRREPAHPMLMLLQRAREWINLDFMAILQDIAPGSLDEARTVLQSRNQRDAG